MWKNPKFGLLRIFVLLAKTWLENLFSTCGSANALLSAYVISAHDKRFRLYCPRFKEKTFSFFPERNAVLHSSGYITWRHLHTPADKDHGWIFSRPDITWKKSLRQQATDKLQRPEKQLRHFSTQRQSQGVVNKQVRRLVSHTLWGMRQVWGGISPPRRPQGKDPDLKTTRGSI